MAKSYPVIVSKPALQDVADAYQWWADHRSVEQAKRWYIVADKAIASLERQPERHPLADERFARTLSLRQLAFGLGRRPSHRIVYIVKPSEVFVYRVRALAQDALSPDDLADDDQPAGL